MYHGDWDQTLAQHGCELPPEAFGVGGRWRGCVNAGLLRIDPKSTEVQREEQFQGMIQHVARLGESDGSYLPEQYFLVKALDHWRHIDATWNWEVFPQFYLRAGQAVSPLHGNQRCPGDVPDKAVKMFHFSGQWLEPWWFLHLSPEAGEGFLQAHFGRRDGGGLLALAVREWLTAVENMRQSAVFSLDEASNIQDHIHNLAYTADKWWTNRPDTCWFCSRRTRCCEECDSCFTDKEALDRKRRHCLQSRAAAGQRKRQQDRKQLSRWNT
jgi:hypothetical protein